MPLFDGKQYTFQKEIIAFSGSHALSKNYYFYFPEKFSSCPVVLVIPPLFANGKYGYALATLSTEGFNLVVTDETVMPTLTDIEVFIFAMERL